MSSSGVGRWRALLGACALGLLGCAGSPTDQVLGDDGGAPPAADGSRATVDLAAPATDLLAVSNTADLGAGPIVDLAATSPDLAMAASPDLAMAGPSFALQVRPVLEAAGCFACHMSTRWKQVIDAKADNTQLVMTLTSVKASQCSTALFIKPGDANGSYLYQKISGTGACFTGASMPEGGPLLPLADRKLIKEWINAGAHPN